MNKIKYIILDLFLTRQLTGLKILHETMHHIWPNENNWEWITQL